jgi:hypothetical protein
MTKALQKAKLSDSLLVIGAPDGVRPLRMTAGASPVPFTAIAKNNVHAQHFLDAYFSPVRPAWPYFFSRRHSILVPKYCLHI